MLSRKNVGWASTCNTVGQTIGYFLGYLFFLALDSPQFCNMFRGTAGETGCVSMEVHASLLVSSTESKVFTFYNLLSATTPNNFCLQGAVCYVRQ